MNAGAIKIRRFWSAFALAALATLPALWSRFAFAPSAGLIDALFAGVAILAAGFMLSWAVEAAEEHVAPGLALAILALITVLPEFVVDFYYAYQGGQHPQSDYVHFAAANMTGANRMLVGLGWPLIVILFWWRSGKRAVALTEDNRIEIGFLLLASAYSFVLVVKQRLDVWDAPVLFVIFGLYLWRLAKLPTRDRGNAAPEDDDDEAEVGPGAALDLMPRQVKFAVMAMLCTVAAGVIVVEAEPFAESLLVAAKDLGVNQFFLVQWVSPLAGELPEMIIAILFTLSLRPGHALGALVSDKINQWTLLLGALPLVFAYGAGHATALVLDARQSEELFLTAAQSLFAVMLLMRLRLTLGSAVILLVLFLAQVGIAFVTQHDPATTIRWLTGFAWVYLGLAGLLAAVNITSVGGTLRKAFGP